MTNDNNLDFYGFVELFKSFYFHSRRDLKDLFDKFASTTVADQDFSIENDFKNDLLDIQRHQTGLITRNILHDLIDVNVKQIYDMIAISSIPCYAVTNYTKTNFFITKDQFKEFLQEHQKEYKTSAEIDQIIFVNLFFYFLD